MTTNINDLLVDFCVGTVGFEPIESLFPGFSGWPGSGAKVSGECVSCYGENHLIRDILADPDAFCFGKREFPVEFADYPKATVHNFQNPACC